MHDDYSASTWSGTPRVASRHQPSSAQYRASAVAEIAPSSCRDTLVVSRQTGIKRKLTRKLLARTCVGALRSARRQFNLRAPWRVRVFFSSDNLRCVGIGQARKIAYIESSKADFWRITVLGWVRAGERSEPGSYAPCFFLS